MDHDVVGRVQALALELVRDYRDRAVIFIAHHAPAAVFAGKLAAFEIEGVAVAVAGWIAEGGDAAVFLDPAHLDVVGDVAPDEVAADAIPRRALGPKRAGVEALDGGVADHVFAEAIIERDDVGVGILDGCWPDQSRGVGLGEMVGGAWARAWAAVAPARELRRKVRRVWGMSASIYIAKTAYVDADIARRNSACRYHFGIHCIYKVATRYEWMKRRTGRIARNTALHSRLRPWYSSIRMPW